MELQANIKRICKERGITLQTLAARMGVTYNTLNNQSVKNPSLRSLERIAAALNCEVWELLKPTDTNHDTTTENSLVCPYCGEKIHICLSK